MDDMMTISFKGFVHDRFNDPKEYNEISDGIMRLDAVEHGFLKFFTEGYCDSGESPFCIGVIMTSAPAWRCFLTYLNDFLKNVSATIVNENSTQLMTYNSEKVPTVEYEKNKSKDEIIRLAHKNLSNSIGNKSESTKREIEQLERVAKASIIPFFCSDGTALYITTIIGTGEDGFPKEFCAELEHRDGSTKKKKYLRIDGDNKKDKLTMA